MASQSLYRKWRSQTFGELVGQEQIIRTLKNALNSGTLAHAYLFTGPRGTGKTSTARLLAKTINCSQSKDGEPCNVCAQCREITAGNSLNVIEIDAASNRGIDSIRELREKVMMPPTIGKYKVYILDEAHMLTTEAFNALLKTLEEPPPHAIFVMATTDVHKMLPTVLSRCQRFDFKRITTRQIVDHLRFVATQEDVTLESGAAELIARAAAGGMRDALSLLDQATAYAGSAITLTQVQAMLGVADPRAIQKFITAIADLNSHDGLHLIHDLSEAGADLRQINGQVAEYWRAMMLARAGANIGEILDYTDDEIREITRLSQLFTLEELTECARIFAQNELVQRNQGTPQLGLELALLSCLALHRREKGDQGTVAATNGAIHTSTTMSARSASSRNGNDTQYRPSAPVAPVVSADASTPAKHEQVQNVVKPVAHPSVEAPAPATSRTPTPDAPDLVLSTPSQSRQATATATPEPSEDENDADDLSNWDDVSYHDEDLDEEPAIPSAPSAHAVSPVTPMLAQVDEDDAFVKDQVSVVPVEVEEVSVAPALSIEEVREKWEYIKRRVKSKKDGPMVAALLNGYTIVGIEAGPVVIIRANAAFHFSSLQKPEHQATIEWALTIELKQECKVHMLPPGHGGFGQRVPIPPPPAPPVVNSMASRATLAQQTTPYRSAYKQPPEPTPENRDHVDHVKQPQPLQDPTPLRPRSQKTQTVSPASAPKEEPQARHQQSGPVSSAAIVPNISSQSSALARKADVRENTSIVPTDIGESRLMFAQKRARNDQVVHEVMRLFKAEVKDIQLK
jgi:DNA polymerase III subunit gamma/tau